MVGVIGAEDAAIFGVITGQHSAAKFANLTTNIAPFPNPLKNLYGIWGTSHQALGLSFLQAGFRGSALSAGIGILRYPSTFICGPYGGGAPFNPAFHRGLYDRD